MLVEKYKVGYNVFNKKWEEIQMKPKNKLKSEKGMGLVGILVIVVIVILVIAIIIGISDVKKMLNSRKSSSQDAFSGYNSSVMK